MYSILPKDIIAKLNSIVLDAAEERIYLTYNDEFEATDAYEALRQLFGDDEIILKFHFTEPVQFTYIDGKPNLVNKSKANFSIYNEFEYITFEDLLIIDTMEPLVALASFHYKRFNSQRDHRKRSEV